MHDDPRRPVTDEDSVETERELFRMFLADETELQVRAAILFRVAMAAAHPSTRVLLVRDLIR